MYIYVLDMINIDNIFESFSQNENLEGINEEVFTDFTQTPVYWVGMYKETILKYSKINKKLLHFFDKVDKNIDLKDVENAGEYVTYTRAWNYIEYVDITKEDHISAIEKYSDKYLDKTLEAGIGFFLGYEEYEKCAHLKGILDISKNFQK